MELLHENKQIYMSDVETNYGLVQVEIVNGNDLIKLKIFRGDLTYIKPMYGYIRWKCPEATKQHKRVRDYKSLLKYLRDNNFTPLPLATWKRTHPRSKTVL